MALHELPIAEMCLLIARGVTPAYDDVGITVLGQKCIRDNRVLYDVARITNPEKKKIPQEKYVRQHDVLVNSTGVGTLGRVAQVKHVPGLVTVDSHVSIVRPDPEKIDPVFFGYAMVLNQPKIEAMGEGATGQTELSRQRLGSAVSVPCPPAAIQRRIADILSAYDDLIENNQRRIKILETMARALYREWFVHFRFPGHESVPMVASPLGEIPEGWEVKKLSAVAQVNRAQISVRDAPMSIHYIDIASVKPGCITSLTTYEFSEAPSRARRIVQHGDVLWSCVRPNRRSHTMVIHPRSGTIASTGFAVLTAIDVPFTYLYCATTTDDFVAYLTNHATGAAYPAVSAAAFENADVLVPDSSVLASFGDATQAMAELSKLLQDQIETLRLTRDLLLPLLLSSRIKTEEVS